MESKYKGEYVLAFPTKLLRKIGSFQGLCFQPEKYLNVLFDEQVFKLRDDLEDDQNYKQFIPYVLLSYGNTLLSYKRGSLQAESRLLNFYSIGIGGHISINDPNLLSTSYEEGLKRELSEEIYIDSTYSLSSIAILNDDSNDVGKVHLGIIHLLRLDQPIVRKKEKSINEIKFVSIDNLKQNINSYENWSKICIENSEKILNS